MGDFEHTEWWAFFIAALVCFVGFNIFAFVRAITKYKRARFLDPLKIMFLGVITSALILYIPICGVGACGGFELAFASIFNTIRLFIIEGDLDAVTTALDALADAGTLPFYRCYTVFFSILFVWAPVLTFTFVLSFFKNILSYIRYFFRFGAEVFVFSDLNEKSLALAESLSKKKRRVLVFTGVERDEKNKDIISRVEDLKALCFSKDISDINFTFLKRRRSIRFFALGDDQEKNVDVALKLIKKFKSRKNTHLYVASTNVETEMMLSSAFDSTDGEANIKARIVNEVQSLILRNLYENGYEKIFRSAYDDGSGVAKINAVVVGMGKQGKEMTKALSWFCQMHGYLVSINSFDINRSAKSVFTSECPELMAMSGNDIPYESKYTIDIHSGVDVMSAEFDEILLSLPRTTYVFVALGNDEKNVAAAVKLRKLFKRKDESPVIQAIVYNADKKESLTGAKNFKNKSYDVDFIGDIKTSYAEEVILGTDVEDLALERHRSYGGSEDDFWRYNYNYKSSVASVIHREMKKACSIPGIEKPKEARTDEETTVIRVMEHNRWNAYMRSEGYVHGERDDIAKTHPSLVPFDELPKSEQEKDDD